MIIEQYIRELINESKWEGISVRDAISKLDSYKDNTWIFFDTETTGLTPHKRQLTEVAAIAVDTNDWESEPKIVDTFDKKVSLDDETKMKMMYQAQNDEEAERKSKLTGKEVRARRGSSIKDLLKMTDYGGKGYTGGYHKEATVIENFTKWVASFPNPLLVIHNASFDMKFMAVRKGTPLERYPVIDTLEFIRLHLVPLLKTIGDSDEESKNLLSNLWIKGKTGRRFLSISQGTLANAFNVSVDNWHTAVADVEMLMKVFYHVYGLMNKWQDIDTSAEHGKILHSKTKSRERKKEKGRKRQEKIGKVRR